MPVLVDKVDIDAEPEVAAGAGAMSIPHVVLYRHGEAVAESIGAVPKARPEHALGLDDELEKAA